MSTDEFQTLNELFLRAVEKHDKPDCFLSKSGGRYHGLSSREALRRVAAVASAFERLGVRRGDRVAILSENRVEWALADYALLGLGAIDVPMYTTLMEPDIEFILRDSQAMGIIVTTDAQLRKVLNVRTKLPDLRFILAMDCARLAGTEAQCWESVVEAGWNSGPDHVDWFRARALEAKPEDIATILYTSGTMGIPKGVVLTHRNIASNVQSCQELFPLTTDDVAISLLPLCHVFERMIDYFFFWQGASIAYAEGFETLPKNLLEVRPTIMAVVPRVLEKIRDKVMGTIRQSPPARQKIFHWALEVGQRYIPYCLVEGRRAPLVRRLEHAVADALVFAKVRAAVGGRVKFLISGAAPLAPDLAKFFHAVGLSVYEGYGLTETSPVVAVNYPGHIKLGTVGPVISGVEVKLGEELEDPEGSVGREILVRGPNVMPGYHHLEEENREAFVDGWFRTGDLGALDSDGYLSITGRKKNLFKTSGGKYISPEKLENLFQGHPYVSQIMVVGEARRFVGALIVPNFTNLETYARSRGIAFNGREGLITHPEIRAFVERQVDEATRWVARHERIRSIALLLQELTIASGELSATLKIKRRVVKGRFRHLIEQMYQPT